MGRRLYARDPRGETSAFVVLMLALVEAFVENPVCAKMFSSGGTAWRSEMAEPESCVCVAWDSEGEDCVSLILKRANVACGEYQVGLTQCIVGRLNFFLSHQPAKDPEKHAHTHNLLIASIIIMHSPCIHHTPTVKAKCSK